MSYALPIMLAINSFLAGVNLVLWFKERKNYSLVAFMMATGVVLLFISMLSQRLN